MKKTVSPKSDSDKKLIIQIPCLNEEEAIKTTLDAIPSEIDGVEKIEIMIIDDGSEDGTLEVARRWGVDHIVGFKSNRGLGCAFMAGLLEARRLNADYLVNTDADNQYYADDIKKLLEPLKAGRADIVVGERPVRDVAHFSIVKKLLLRVGSWVVRKLSGADVKDVPSGFRAYNNAAIQRLFIINRYTHTIETLFAAREFGLRVEGTEIRVNPEVLRPSRLIKSPLHYIFNNSITISRFCLVYYLCSVFLLVGISAMVPGLFLLGWFFYLTETGGGEISSQPLLYMVSLIVVGLSFLFMYAMAVIMRSDRKSIGQTILEIRESVNYTSEGFTRSESSKQR